MKLLQGETGHTYTVTAIALDEAIKRRFQILGMTIGTTVEIINQKPSGNKIIRLRGTRFAIGRDFAEGITVEPIKETR